MARRRSDKKSDAANSTKTTASRQPKNTGNTSKNASKRMLIDASQMEETRVAVLQGGRMEDFDIESLVRKQLKGNIYLAKVTRVEPSLQAAFVNYGGNRHGFLPFSEIHPDYYRIPVADRERLMAEQEGLERKAAEEAERLAQQEDALAEQSTEEATKTSTGDDNIIEIDDDGETVIEAGADADFGDGDEDDIETEDASEDLQAAENADAEEEDETKDSAESEDDNRNNGRGGRHRGRGRHRHRNGRGGRRRYANARHGEDRVTDEDEDEVGSVEPFWKRIRRAYKIQEVIKRGQIMLIQISKEERGNKGAAVTSYITLPGRYCVLMPNSPQSGGVSRKIANYKDRKRMREILKDLNVPDGMSVILRTAGTSRTKVEIKRDLDYLMRLWNSIRDLTLKSSAPAVINEEGSLIRRAIRDIYNKDIDEVVVSGDEGYKTARDMMKMLMPSHVKKVTQYKDETPLFISENIESQIEDIHSQTVHLKSGGYLVINPTEALVSIDVNSGRATRERHIEDTALKTNLEAAEEVARQLKLRDLGGLVVIDFIDMENRRYNGKVERALREALSGDRARIQMGRISSFGLMELSRQRLHPSLTETHFETCPHCRGIGLIKTVDTAALAVLRAIEEKGISSPSCIFTIRVPENVALYLFNQKRRNIAALEERYDLTITIEIGHVDDEKGFLLSAEKKIVDEDESDDDETEDKDIPAVTDDKPENSEKSGKPESGDKGERQRSRRGGRRRSGQDRSSEAKPDPRKDAETPAAATQEKKPQAKPAAAKQEQTKAESKAESKSESKAEAKPEPKAAATNDNAGAPKAADKPQDKPVKDYEKVNEPPKSKKKGWWQKIVEN